MLYALCERITHIVSVILTLIHQSHDSCPMDRFDESLHSCPIDHSQWNEMAVKVGVETYGVIVSKFQGHVTLTLHSAA